MNTVLVIGSNSFSGSDFIDLLLEKGNYRVIGISRSPEKPALFLPYKQKTGDLFTFFQIDLNHDLDKLSKIIDQFAPTWVVNFAAQSEVGPSWDYPHHWFQTNAVALTKLANLLKDKPSIKKYVHISSPEVYGTCSGFVKETAPLNPSTPYAASKAAADLSLTTFYKNFHFPLVTIRATNVYGPCQQLFKIIPRSILSLKMGKTLHLHGGGKAVKSYIHIRDVSRAELLVMERGEIGEIYHIAPDRGIAIKDVIQLVCDQLGGKFDHLVCPAPERLGQDKAYTLDCAKIRTELGWEAKVPFEKGLEKTIHWVERHFTALTTSPLEYQHKP